jgi:hypothetical protein
LRAFQDKGNGNGMFKISNHSYKCKTKSKKMRKNKKQMKEQGFALIEEIDQLVKKKITSLESNPIISQTSELN